MLSRSIIASSSVYGLLASVMLLAVYFSILTLVSGWSFAFEQFRQFWYFVVSLAIGFGIQIGLYKSIKRMMHSGEGTGAVAAVTGTTSTATMISCCAHYLVNIIPVLGVTGAVSIVAQYQVELFWAGVLFNTAGIVYIGNRFMVVRQSISAVSKI